MDDSCLQRSKKDHQKTASGISVFLLEELGDARLRCAQLRKYVDEAVKIINKSEHRDHFFEVAAHLMHGIPDTLLRMDKALNAAALAASKLDYEEIKDTLRPEKVEELEEALKDVRIRRVKKQSEKAMNITEAAAQLERLASLVESTGSLDPEDTFALIRSLEGNSKTAAEGGEAIALRKLAARILDKTKQRPSRLQLASYLRQILFASLDSIYSEKSSSESANGVEKTAGGFAPLKIRNRQYAEGVSTLDLVDALWQAAENLFACCGVNSKLSQSFEDALVGYIANLGPLAGMPDNIVVATRTLNRNFEENMREMRTTAREMERLGRDIKKLVPEAERNIALIEEGEGRREMKWAKEKESEKEVESRFEEGKPADPTENMDSEDAEKWKEMTEKHKDKFKEASSVAEEAKRSRFEEGKPADPTENMDSEDAEKWKEMTEKHKDKFKVAVSNPPHWRAVAEKLLDKRQGTSQDDFHYRAYMRSIIHGWPSEHLVKKFPGAEEAKNDLIDESGR